MRLASLALACAFLTAPAAAQDTMQHDHGLHGAMATMQEQMAKVPMTGDPDSDFAAMMIPHHQGAIAMAEAQIADGKDPELHRLAREIIAAQEREIAILKQWLQEHGR